MNVSKNITDPLVSIVTPCFNAEKTLAVTIESILNQTYRNLELIIIDDCSLDSSLQVANSFMSIDPRIKVLKLDCNSGVAKARNKGIKAGSGQLLAFCDADDIWYPTKLTEQVNLLSKTNAAICFSSYDLIDPEGNVRGSRFITKSSVQLPDMLYFNVIGNLTGLIDTGKLGKPIQDECRHEDYLMWLQLLSRTDRAVGLNKPLAGYRIHDSNLTGNKFKSFLWHYKVLRRVSIPPIKACWYSVVGRLMLVVRRMCRSDEDR